MSKTAAVLITFFLGELGVHSFAYKTLKNLAEKNGGKIETSLSDDRLAITTGWVINNFS